MSHAVDTIRLLLTSNPNTVNVQDKKVETATCYAIRNCALHEGKYADTVKILCENGADAGLRDRNEQTPLHCLSLNVRSSQPTDVDLIALLLAHGADVGDTDADGNTPLHHAARDMEYVEATSLNFLWPFPSEVVKLTDPSAVLYSRSYTTPW